MREHSFEPGHALLIASCIRCGAMCQGDPDTMPSALVHEDTRCPIGPDGQQVRRGQPGVSREPLCPGCVTVMTAAQQAGGSKVPWPLARVDRINFPDDGEVPR